MGRVLALAILLAPACAAAQPDPAVLRDGDLIFHESRSAQAAAVREVQGSTFTHVGLLFHDRHGWRVLEAVGPVRWTPLDRFVSRGGAWRVMRARDVGVDAGRLRREAERYLGRPYDTRFAWDDRRIYCSELVVKAYERALSIDLGGRADWSTIDLSGPHARSLLRARGGRRPTGVIVTPGALLASDRLVEVASGD